MMTGQVKTRKVAVTGGIGTGKSYICKLLGEHGIRVYDCDAAAKRLMARDETLQQAICRLVGPDAYHDGVLQKNKLAQFLLGSAQHRQALDDIIHPAVASDFIHSGMQWLESAIFFDSGFDRRVDVDIVVCVSAPLEVRVQRVMSRDGISREKALEWIRNQLPQNVVEKRSDLVIVNDGKVDLETEVSRLLHTIGNMPEKP